MSRKMFLLLILLFLIGSFAGAVYSDDESEIINPNNLLSYADDTIFVRFAFLQDFSEDQGYVNELPNPTTIHEYFVYDGVGTDRLISLLPAAETIKTTNKRLCFENSRKREFHVTYSVLQWENVPESGNGLCWIGYTNELAVGKGRGSGIIIYPGDQAYFFSPGENGTVYKSIFDLSFLDPLEEIQFDFIRLDKTIYVYADGYFIFSYKDDIDEMVSFQAGAELFQGANQIRCDFDNFSMRVK